jgi:hypothetical protein
VAGAQGGGAGGSALRPHSKALVLQLLAIAAAADGSSPAARTSGAVQRTHAAMEAAVRGGGEGREAMEAAVRGGGGGREGLRVGEELTRLGFATPAYTSVARTHAYPYAAKVWDFVQGPFFPPVPNRTDAIRNCSIAVCRSPCQRPQPAPPEKLSRRQLHHTCL